jgi:hypothetical protein
MAWFGIVILGLANATIRQVVYARYVGELAAHQISTLTFAILVGLYTWALSGFLNLSSPGEAIGVGLVWMVLTLVFEPLWAVTSWGIRGLSYSVTTT